MPGVGGAKHEQRGGTGLHRTASGLGGSLHRVTQGDGEALVHSGSGTVPLLGWAWWGASGRGSAAFCHVASSLLRAG